MSTTSFGRDPLGEARQIVELGLGERHGRVGPEPRPLFAQIDGVRRERDGGTRVHGERAHRVSAKRFSASSAERRRAMRRSSSSSTSSSGDVAGLQHDEQMVEQIRRLRDQRLLVLGQRGDGHLDRLFAELLGRLDRGVVEQPPRMGVFGPGGPARFDGGGEPESTHRCSYLGSYTAADARGNRRVQVILTKVGASACLPGRPYAGNAIATRA